MATTQNFKRPSTGAPVSGETGLPNTDKFQNISATRPRIPIASEDMDSELNSLTDAVNLLFDAAVGGLAPDNSITLAKLSHLTAGSMYVMDGTTAPTELTIGAEGSVLTTVSGLPTWNAAPASPIGSVITYAGTTAPTGWLICAGQAVSRATYSNLFSIISTTYGVGDGVTTFNVPDLRGRSTIGLDNMNGGSANIMHSIQADALGGVGGNTASSSNTGGYTMTAADLQHKHETSVGAASQISLAHPFGQGTTVLGAGNSGGSGSSSPLARLTNFITSFTSQPHVHTNAQEDTVTPYMAMNKIIKT